MPPIIPREFQDIAGQVTKWISKGIPCRNFGWSPEDIAGDSSGRISKVIAWKFSEGHFGEVTEKMSENWYKTFKEIFQKCRRDF